MSSGRLHFFMVAPNICGSLILNLLHITFLDPRILKWLLDILRICAPQHCTLKSYFSQAHLYRIFHPTLRLKVGTILQINYEME
jgi:hypothetical protein